MAYVVTAPTPAASPIVGTNDLFPIRRVYCVGRNYAEHAKEMGFSDRDPPFFFMKPADAVVPVAQGDTAQIEYPMASNNFHHEIELVVAISHGGRNIKAADATKHIYGYAVGLDMTRRDCQFAMRDKGRPWELGKAFDQSAPMGPITPASQCGFLSSGFIKLDVNDKPRQASDINKLIWNVNETIEHLSTYFTLQAGDLIFTGTPEGVAAVVAGDRLRGEIAGLGRLQIQITPLKA